MIFNFLLLLIIIFLYVFFLGLGKLKKSSKDKLFLFFCFWILFLLVGFRSYSSGNDTKTYVEVFKTCSLLKWSAVDSLLHYDKGYLFFNVAVSYITTNSRVYLLLLSFICNYSIYRFVKNNSNNYLVSILLYISLLFFYSSMSMARQFLAFSLILFGFDFVKNNNFIRFVLIIVCASLFHSSAIIALIIYPLYHIKFTYNRSLLIIIFVLIVYVFLGNVFNNISIYLNKTTSYLETLGNVKIANILYTAVYFIIYLFAVFFLKGKEHEQDNSFYLYIALMSFLINFLSIKISILARAAQYFTIFNIVLIPNIISNSNNNKNTKTFINCTICILFILYANTIIYFRPEWNSAFNYTSCVSEESCKIW